MLTNLEVQSLIAAIGAGLGEEFDVEKIRYDEVARKTTEIVATLQQEAFMSLDAPIERVAAWDTPYPPGSLENHYLPSVEQVVQAVKRVAAY